VELDTDFYALFPTFFCWGLSFQARHNQGGMRFVGELNLFFYGIESVRQYNDHVPVNMGQRILFSNFIKRGNAVYNPKHISPSK
jgi:hypothetical protein